MDVSFPFGTICFLYLHRLSSLQALSQAGTAIFPMSCEVFKDTPKLLVSSHACVAAEGLERIWLFLIEIHMASSLSLLY